jgi:hypothetical protein
VRDQHSLSFVQGVPNFVALMQWAKLRLIKGLHEQDLAQASLEVRHLAKLCGSTGTLIGTMTQLSMYEVERLVWQREGAAPQVPLPSPEEVAAARSLAMTQPYLLAPRVPRAVKARALECGPSLHRTA